MKRKLTVILLVFIVTALVGCGGADEDIQQEAPDIILVTDESGLGDQSFNDACWAGCERGAEEFGLNVYCIESETGEDYAAKITEAVGMAPQLIICAGADMEYVLFDIAAANPQQKFAILDTNEIGENVTGITFRSCRRNDDRKQDCIFYRRRAIGCAGSISVWICSWYCNCFFGNLY